MAHKQKISKCAKISAHTLSLIMALLAAGIVQSSCVIAAEGTIAVATPSGNEIPKKPQISSAAMDLPLSTWVGPGDVLRIKAYPDTASFISGAYTIFDSGFIILPILGMVQVSNRSINSLTRQLTEAYAKYMAYPSIQIEPMIHIFMLGGFLHPGSYLVNPLHPLSNALSVAGGTIRDDGLKLLRWERSGKVLASNLTAEVEGSQSLWAMGVKSNDQICVTVHNRGDISQLTTFITSSLIASGTLVITVLVLLRTPH